MYDSSRKVWHWRSQLACVSCDVNFRSLTLFIFSEIYIPICMAWSNLQAGVLDLESCLKCNPVLAVSCLNLLAPTVFLMFLQDVATKSFGALDMGGASTEITFMSPTSGKRTLDFRLYGKNYTIYTRSYLCYGLNEVYRRYLAQLAKVWKRHAMKHVFYKTWFYKHVAQDFKLVSVFLTTFAFVFKYLSSIRVQTILLQYPILAHVAEAVLTNQGNTFGRSPVVASHQGNLVAITSPSLVQTTGQSAIKTWLNFFVFHRRVMTPRISRITANRSWKAVSS